MRKLSNALLVLVGAIAPLIAACSGDSASSPPTAPTPTTASINVTVDTPIRVGATAQATGTAALSNGQSQPLTSGWQDIDPAEYGAPDPAQLMNPDHGFSSLLAETTDATKGDSVRGGKDNSEVLTEYSGQISGEAAASLRQLWHLMQSTR